jgi:hypothetical protein
LYVVASLLTVGNSGAEKGSGLILPLAGEQGNDQRLFSQPLVKSGDRTA